MKIFYCILLFACISFAAHSQRKMGLLEYATNATVAIRTDANPAMNATGLCFIFKTDKGMVPSVIIHKRVAEAASSFTFLWLEADERQQPRYDKPQEITIRKSDLTIINHPDPSVDLVLLPVSSILAYFNAKKINLSYFPLSEVAVVSDSALRLLKPVEEVLMVGHPAGIQKELAHKPLVKSGVTATAPYVDFNSKKETLVNITPYDGADGAPVFVYQYDNVDRYDQRMEGQRVILLGLAIGAYTKGFKERVNLDSQGMLEDITIVLGAKKILEFKTALNKIRK